VVGLVRSGRTVAEVSRHLDLTESAVRIWVHRAEDRGSSLSVAEIRNVERRLCRNRPPLRASDYIAVPRASGYRAVHVVVSYPDEDGVARAIEGPLRTRIMHEWAVSVERLGGAH
jgi:ppGpp synthetase/RelA/SpoT-type nucleotidyltranferase